MTLTCFFSALLAAEPLPVSQLAAQPRFTEPKLSPDGSRLCAIVRKDANQSLAEISLTGAQPRDLAVFNGHGRLRDFWWKGSDLLLLLVEDQDGAGAFRSLDLRTGRINHLDSIWQGGLLNMLPKDPEAVLFQRADYHPTGMSLHKVNLRSGKDTLVKLNPIPPAVTNWILNEDGEAVAAICESNKKTYMLWRTALGDDWQRRELGPTDRPDLAIIAVHPDQKRLLAWDYTGEGPAKAVALDPASMEKTTLFAPAQVDPDSVVFWADDWARARAIAYEVERPAWHFLDPEAEAIKKSIDAALPDTVNAIQSSSSDEQIMIIYARSDRDRGSYYLLDRQHKRLLPLGSQYSGYDPGECRPSQRFEFTARDGLVLHGRLLLPKVAAGVKPPLVVLTSPWFDSPRERFDFSALAQFLATRGYAVAQFEPRGTHGYGRVLLNAGEFQMDSGIPNDLADGTRWLIKQGYVDGERIALAGKQWGGLIAIQAIAKNPGLFAVWLNFDTPVDLNEVSFADLALSLDSDVRTVVAKPGDWDAARAHTKRLIPDSLVPTISIPSFHYYRGFGGRLYAAAPDMKKLLAKGPARYEIYDHPRLSVDTVEEYETKQQERNKDFAQHLLAFLDAQLHPAR